MGKIRVGNKQNSFLNGEWAGHVKKSWKKVTSGIRRSFDKKVIKQELDAIQEEKINRIDLDTNLNPFRK